MSRDDIRKLIFSGADLTPLKVDVPEWGCAVWVRRLTGAEGMAAFDIIRLEDASVRRARFVQLVACDESGARLFDDDEVEKLPGLSLVALERVFRAGLDMNMITKEAADEMGKS